MTGSGSILVNDVKTAAKLMNRLGSSSPAVSSTAGHVLTFDDSDLCIQLQWNEIQNHLVLRRLSGDATRYSNICQELLQNVL